MRIDLNETANILENADNILLLSHSHPDGDTLGSASALARALISMGKRVRVECSDPIPKDFSFMFEGLDFGDFEPDLIAAIDIADTKLLGRDAEGKYSGKIGLCIDHHGSNILYADKVYLEPDSASTAEIIYLLLQKMNVEITPQIASCLFTGVTTDTGCFRFSNTTVRTFEIAAALAKAGADTYNIIQVFFETKTKTYAYLERLALDGLEFYHSGRVAIITVTQEMYEKTGSNEQETEALAPLTRQIEGVEIGITIREKKDKTCKASIRTFESVNAAELASAFGGGGHLQAAACRLNCGVEEAKELLVEKCGEILK